MEYEVLTEPSGWPFNVYLVAIGPRIVYVYFMDTLESDNRPKGGNMLRSQEHINNILDLNIQVLEAMDSRILKLESAPAINTEAQLTADASSRAAIALERIATVLEARLPWPFALNPVPNLQNTPLIPYTPITCGVGADRVCGELAAPVTNI